MTQAQIGSLKSEKPIPQKRAVPLCAADGSGRPAGTGAQWVGARLACASASAISSSAIRLLGRQRSIACFSR